MISSYGALRGTLVAVAVVVVIVVVQKRIIERGNWLPSGSDFAYNVIIHLPLG